MEATAVGSILLGISSAWAVLRGAVPLMWSALNLSSTALHTLAGGGGGGAPTTRSADPVLGGVRARIFDASATGGSGTGESTAEIYAKNQRALATVVLMTGGWVLLFWFIMSIINLLRTGTMQFRQRRVQLKSAYAADKDALRMQSIMTHAPALYASQLLAANAYSNAQQSAASDARADTTMAIAGLQLTLIATEAFNFFVTTLVAIKDALITSTNSAFLLARVFLIGAFLSVSGTLFLSYTDVIINLYALIWANGLRPILLDRLLFPLAVIFIVLPFLLVYPFVITILGTQKVFSSRFVGKVVVRVSIPQISRGFIGFARALAALIVGLFYWFVNRPSSSLIPLDRGIGILLDTGRELLLTAVIPTCVLINYVIGGFVDVLTHPSLTSFITLLVNLPIKFLQTFFWLPIVTGELPPVEALDDHSTTMFQNLGDWLQNATVATGSVFIGDLKDYYFYNATTPPTRFVSETDSFQYVVRAFGASIWLAITTAIATAVAAVLELLNIALKPLEWFRPGGNAFFTFGMIRDKAHMTIEYLSTIINIAPNCVVPGGVEYTAARVVRYGDIVAGLGRSLIALVFIAKDLVLGEIYSLFEGVEEVFLYFSAGYFLANGREIVEYEAGISRAAAALGCAVANVDEGFGIFIENAVQIVFDSVPMVLFRFVLYVRYAFTKGTSSVLASLDPAIDQLEADLLDLRKIVFVIYRFANRNSEQCVRELDPVCGLGSLLENLIKFVAQLIVLVIRSVRIFVERFVNLLLSGSFGEVPRITFKPLVDTANRVGASLGVFLGTIIPIDLECHQTQPNICRVRFFLQLPERQTPTICLATFFVMLGGVFAGIVALFVLFYDLLLNLDFIVGGNPAEIIANNSRVIVNLIKKIFFIVKVYFTSPLCPFGHFVDCPLSIFIPGADFASRFLCFVNDSIVTLIDELQDLVVSVIELAFGIFRIIFTADFSITTIKSVFDAAWRIFSNFLETVILLLLNYVIGILFVIIRGICNFFGLRDCVAFIDRIRDNLASAGLSTRPADNYLREDLKKRRAELEEETGPGSSHERRARYARTNLFLDITDERMRDKVSFQLYRAFGFIYEDGVNSTTGETVWRKRAVTIEELPMHLANYTVWSPGTRCAQLIHMAGRFKMSELSISDQLNMYECIEQKSAAIAFAASSPVFAWLPEDILYNKFRLLFVAAEMALSVAVIFQYFFDRALPHERVMSADYRMAWQGMYLNVTHLDTTFREFYPNKTSGGVARNASQIELAEFEIFRQNLTLSEYWYNNFYWPRYKSAQAFYEATQPITLPNGTVVAPASFKQPNDLQTLAGVGLVDTMSSLNALFIESTNFILDAVDLQKKHVDYILSLDGNVRTVENVDLVTNLTVNDPCYLMPYAICVVNGTTNTRHEIWKRTGAEGLALHDTQKLSEGIYFTTARFMNGLFSIGNKFVTVFTGNTYYHDELDNSNYMRDDYAAAGGTMSNSQYKHSTSIDVPLHDLEADVHAYHRKKYPEAYAYGKRAAPVTFGDLDEADRNALIHARRERIIRERTEKSRLFQEWRQNTTRATPRTWPTWATWRDATWRGISQRVDRFMHDNDAAYPSGAIEVDSETRAVHVKRDVLASDDGMELARRKHRLAQRSKLAVVVISAVSAVSSYVQLNLTHVPIWCNSTRELRQACAYSDWRNAAEYLRDDPILYENFRLAFNVSANSIIEQFAPRTPEARLFRENVWQTVGAMADFGSEILHRVNRFYEYEHVQESLDRVKEKTNDLARDAAEEARMRTEQETDQALTSHKRSIETHPRFKHLFQTTHNYVPIEEQRKEADRWFRSKFGDALDPQHARVGTRDAQHERDMQAYASRHASRLTEVHRALAGEHQTAAWMYMADRSRVEDPESMLLAAPLTGTAHKVKAAALNGTDLWSSALRAHFGWLREERDMQDDYDAYHTMFVAEADPTVSPAAAAANEKGASLRDSEKHSSLNAYPWKSLSSSELALQLTQRASAEAAKTSGHTPADATVLDGKSTTTLAVPAGVYKFKSMHYRCKLYGAYVQSLARELNISDPIAAPSQARQQHACSDPYAPDATIPRTVTMQVWDRAIVEESIPARAFMPGLDPEATIFAAALPSAQTVRAFSAETLAKLRYTRRQVVAVKLPRALSVNTDAAQDYGLQVNALREQQRTRAASVEPTAPRSAATVRAMRAAGLQRPGDAVLLPVKNLVQLTFEFDAPLQEARDNATRVAEVNAASRVLTHNFFELDDPLADANETSNDAAARNNPAGLTLVCPFPSSFICDPKFGCYVVAEMALQLKRLVLQFIDLMTAYVPVELVRKLMYLPYAYSSTEPARIGFGEYPPYYYARGISPWYFWRGLPSEIAGAQNGTDGPKWSTVVRAITGGVDFPEFFLTNGTAYRAYTRYLGVRANATLLNDPQNSDIRDNLQAYEALFFIQDTLGIKFLEFVDTFLAWAREVYPAVLTFAFSLVTCNYARQLGCYRRITSVAGAVKLYMEVTGPILLFMFVLGLPGIEVVTMLFAAILVPWVGILAWGWSPICSLPPVCAVPELFDLVVYTVAPRCDVFEGNFITNPNYVSDNCFMFETGASRLIYNQTHPDTGAPQRTYVNCYDFGFRNEYDGFEAYEVYYQAPIQDPSNPAWRDGTRRIKALPFWLRFARALTDTVYSTVQAITSTDLFKRPGLTRDWKGEFHGLGENIYRDFYTNFDPHYRNQNVCADLSIYRSIGLLMLKAASAVVVSTSVFRLIAFLLLGVARVAFQTSVFCFVVTSGFLARSQTTLAHNYAHGQYTGDALDQTPYGALYDPAMRQRVVDEAKFLGLASNDANGGGSSAAPSSLPRLPTGAAIRRSVNTILAATRPTNAQYQRLPTDSPL